jgi:UDP-N-acetylmuramoyl-tripeptide--D-alanyl-D-alanine ligase
VVAVTGSVGKTSTKELIADMAAARGPSTRSPGTWNGARALAATLRGAPPGGGVCVLEIGAKRRGWLAQAADLLRPDVVVVTNVLGDHVREFGSLEAIAEEKSELVAGLAPGGTAVLNADDPLVAAMRRRCRGRVLSYGRAEGADLRAVDVRADWPARLAFTLLHEDRARRVQTRLVGGHHVGVALAALGGALAAGVPLDDAVAVLERAEPQPGRFAVRRAAGVDFLRDDFKAAISSYGPALDLLRTAAVRRRVAVLGKVNHYQGGEAEAYLAMAERAAAAADHVIFTGFTAWRVLGGAALPGDGRVRVVETVREATEAVRALVEPGDLVLLKGDFEDDHLARVALDFEAPVTCWEHACGRMALCDGCERLRVPAPPPSAASGPGAGPPVR